MTTAPKRRNSTWRLRPAKPHEPSIRPPKRDFRQEVADRIINMLENGAAPWQKPWTADETFGMPQNPNTGRNYRGGNALHLMVTALQRGYNDPRWMTYKQASDQGWQVRRGEKGTQIEFWDVRPADKEGSPGDDAGSSNGRNRRDARDTRLVHRVYTVFNVKQIEGIPEYQPKRPTPFEAVNSVENILARKRKHLPIEPFGRPSEWRTVQPRWMAGPMGEFVKR